MTPRISVVVPVYNPGPRFDPCIASLRNQTLPRSAYDIILVDDGSTDGTAERLDAMAAADPLLTVIHQPNSGWPGRPRNVGTDAATGDYVLYVDNDDWLAPEALERLTAHVADADVDVVMFKEVGENRQMSRSTWRRTVTDAELGRDPIMRHLTPHKMFRRAFLVENGIRFPEGKRRLEDHHFVMRAYFAAKRIDILADYGYYHWIRHPGRGVNASRIGLDPEGYYANMREVLDIVDANTEHGYFRDKLYSHWFSGKILRRAGRLYLFPEQYHRWVWDELRKVVLERFPPDLDQLQPVINRVRAALVRQDRLEDMLRLGQAMDGLRLHAYVDDVHWRAGALITDVHVALHVNGEQLMLRAEEGDRVRWVPPLELDGVPPEAFTFPARRMLRLSAALSRRERADYFLPRLSMRSHPRPGPTGTIRPVARARIRVDPLTAAVGGPLESGAWRLEISSGLAGFGTGTALGVHRADHLHDRWVRPRRFDGLVATPYWDHSGALGVEISERRWSR